MAMVLARSEGFLQHRLGMRVWLQILPVHFVQAFEGHDEHNIIDS